MSPPRSIPRPPRRGHHLAHVALLAAAATSLAGCPDIGAEHGDALEVLGPIAVGSHLVTADRASHELVIVDVDAGDAPSIARVALAGGPSRLEALPDGSGVLVLERDSATLELVDLPGGDRRTWALGAPFEALAIAPDASAAIAYFPPGSATTVFHNTSEIAHIDLDPDVPPDAAVTRRTLATLGGAPLAVLASPLVGDRRYAFVLSTEHVAILDLHAPTTRERSVPLVSLNTGGVRTPRDIRFAVDGDALWAVVTTVEGASAFALELTMADGDGDEPPFKVRLNQLAGITPGGDLALVRLPDDDTLAAILVSPSLGAATVVTLHNGHSEEVALENGVNRIATYLDAGRPIAVMHRAGAKSFHILDVAALTDKKDKALRTRFARAAIRDLVAVPDSPLFFAFHDGTDEAVSVINADTDRITSFGRTGLVRSHALSEPLGRLYLTTSVGADDYLVSVTLPDLHPQSSLIPGGADRLLVLPDAMTVATSASLPGGHLVLWPADATLDDDALALPAYLLDGLLDRANP